ncbi:hypothetical protein ACFWPH_32420 [Nocardia sp. NPDC058499]|uniref:hypothetical protein n=1 Tax=Nocardia sp. NPDC058499 TaxID=3346530 RepID=UPI003658336F
MDHQACGPMQVVKLFAGGCIDPVLVYRERAQFHQSDPETVIAAFSPESAQLNESVQYSMGG